ncbi:carbonic anhydrase family protein [Portibacter lacus]|uniref:Carbonic anhydrase n=1 Tax=Portibacter lacus TaxID=1099794 RepID=A0AA37SSN7_9BACT|nr:carbonic anhydrase family protein [Portibacter lacus]GLR19487.1 carbonic anhydrase [Portibacter lacus]
MDAFNAEAQAKVTPENALQILLEGNQRFLNNVSINRNFNLQIQQTSTGQYPIATVLSCIDSRIPTEIIFDQGIGDLFNARIAGNFINDDILGSLEFACKLAGSKVIMVLGHTSCGAIKGACDNAKLGNLTQMLAKITPAVEAVKTSENEERNSSNTRFVNKVAEQNVLNSIEAIKAGSPVLVEMMENNEISIIGAMYDVNTGGIKLI